MILFLLFLEIFILDVLALVSMGILPEINVGLYVCWPFAQKTSDLNMMIKHQLTYSHL